MNFTSRISNTYQQTTGWLAQKLESPIFSRLKESAEGVLKAALGVHYIFDLGLQWVPEDHPWYRGLEITKYTMTGITLIGSTISAYFHHQQNRHMKNRILSLESALIRTQTILHKAEQIILQEDELLRQSGYPSERTQKLSIEIEEPVNHSTQYVPSTYDAITNTFPILSLRALINGAISATVVQYLFTLNDAILPPSLALNVIKYTLSSIVLISSTADNYISLRNIKNRHEILNNLMRDISIARQQLNDIENLLGSHEQLKQITEMGAKAITPSIRITIETDNHISPPSRMDRIFNSKPMLYTQALLYGATKGSGIHYMLEWVLPCCPTVAYTGGVLTLTISGIRAGYAFNKEIREKMKIEQLENDIASADTSLEIAEKIISMQSELEPLALETANDDKKETPAIKSYQSIIADSSHTTHFFKPKESRMQSDRTPLLQQISENHAAINLLPHL